MAFPLSGRLRSYGANQPVYASDLNAVQDAILEIFAEHDLVTVDAVPACDTGLPAWEVMGATPQYGWEKVRGVGSSGVLCFNIQARRSLLLKAVALSYYNAHPSTDYAPNADLYQPTCGFDAADDSEPGLGSSLASFSGLSVIPHGHWGMRQVSGLSVTVISGRRLLLVVNTATAGDRVAGLRLSVVPLTE